jgi:hypothetical protein
MADINRIPLITTPIDLKGDGISPIWFRWMQYIDGRVATLPPAPEPPPPPSQANILFQDNGVDLGTANPPFVSFNFGVTAARSGSTVSVDYAHVPKITDSGAPSVAWIGTCNAITAGVTISAGVFSIDPTAGDIFWLFNNTSGALTITQAGGMTLRLIGTTTTGNRTLPAYGIGMFWFPTNDVCICSGVT